MKEVNPIDLSWNNDYIHSVLPISLSLVFFSMYWFFTNSLKIKHWFYNRYDFDKAAYMHIFTTKIFGFFSMGVFPISICLICMPEVPFEKYGFRFISQTATFSFWWVIVLSSIVIPMVYLNAKKPKNLINYPQIRSRVWTKKIILLNAIGWVLYLVGYEFLFRGVLLMPLVDAIGVWPTITLNIALYSATHIPKGIEETLGAIPLGLVLCILTLLSGTIWIALIVHVVMAWTNSFTAFKFHPDMHCKKSES